jgi:hypothetical protein
MILSTANMTSFDKKGQKQTGSLLQRLQTNSVIKHQRCISQIWNNNKQSTEITSIRENS